jgi:anti-anti-sigma regulatory factor
MVGAGLDAGDRIMVFTEAQPATVVATFGERGVLRGQPRQVQVLSAREAYLPAGRFEPTRVLESLLGHIDQANKDGYTGLRLVGDMAWAATVPAGADLLADYEARVNQIYMDGRALGVCLYDRDAFPDGLLREVACAHPATAVTAGDTGWAPLLRIRRTVDPYGLQLTGEADVSNRQALATALSAALDQQPDTTVPIMVDVSGLRFLDAAATVLLGRLALQAPAGINLYGCRGSVETTLDHLGVSRMSKVRVTRAGVGADKVEAGTAP